MAGFVKATRKQINLRVAFCGPTGSGKTYTALLLAEYLAKQTGKRIAVIDSEKGSAEKYADRFDFDHLILDTFEPEKYIAAIKLAAESGYILVIDSLSHAWEGKGGMLEQVDHIGKRLAKGGTPNSYTAWREGTPMQNKFVDAMLDYPGHLIATMRVKMEHIMEKDGQGKTVVRKIGLRPIQRDGLEYEFDIVGDVDNEHILCVTKSRCFELADYVEKKPGEEFAKKIWIWAEKGDKRPDKPGEQAPSAVTPVPTSATHVSIQELSDRLSNVSKYGMELEAFRDEVNNRETLSDLGPLFSTLPQGPNRQEAAKILVARGIVVAQDMAGLEKIGKWMGNRIKEGIKFGPEINTALDMRMSTLREDNASDNVPF